MWGRGIRDEVEALGWAVSVELRGAAEVEECHATEVGQGL